MLFSQQLWTPVQQTVEQVKTPIGNRTAEIFIAVNRPTVSKTVHWQDLSALWRYTYSLWDSSNHQLVLLWIYSDCGTRYNFFTYLLKLNASTEVHISCVSLFWDTHTHLLVLMWALWMKVCTSLELYEPLSSFPVCTTGVLCTTKPSEWPALRHVDCFSQRELVGMWNCMNC